MRSNYLLVLLIFSCQFLSAQIQFEPLQSNPVLQLQQTISDQTAPTTADHSAFRVTSNCTTSEDSLYSESTTIYVVSGKTVTICMDPLGFSLINSATCLNCDALQFGIVTPVENSFCFRYRANANLELATGDTLVIEACDTGGCEELSFPIVIKRANRSFNEAAHLPMVSSKDTFCVSTIELPGVERSYSYLDCHNPTLGRLSAPDSCFVLSTARFAEVDEICLEICDEYCVCDTYFFPVKIKGDTLSLPFFDDFSYDGPYPDQQLWLDDNVYVNNHFAYQPLSVGVATFDGLDKGGSPYGGGFGPSDYLTSNYLDLEGLSVNDNVYLSFYLEPKGLSYFPLKNDTLVLQFRDTAGIWRTIDTYQGLGASTGLFDTITFDSLYAYQIRSVAYLYDGFQFRFINHCNRIGMQYLWHLDYVRLNKDEIPDGHFPDIAFTATPNTILQRYRDMPWNQFDGFESSELRGAIDISLYSHFVTTETADPSNLQVRELNSNSLVVSLPTLLEVPPITTEVQRNVPPGAFKTYTNPVNLSGIIGSFPPDANNLVFDMTYHFEVGEEDVTQFPATKRNNTVHTRTEFSDYFGYDDGSAELIVASSVRGTQMASQFHANRADTLRGVRFFFPYSGQNLNGEFVIKVWQGNLDSEPVYVSPPWKPFFPNVFGDTLLAFTTYKFVDGALEEMAIPLPSGDFFVGIEQTSLDNSRVGIGYDMNSPEAGEYQFFRNAGVNGTWVNVNRPGALMIRPVLGGDFPRTTAVEDVSLVNDGKKLLLFPNPATDELNVLIDHDAPERLLLQVYDIAGKLVTQQQGNEKLALAAWHDGLYLLQLIDPKSGQSWQGKFSVQH